MASGDTVGTVSKVTAGELAYQARTVGGVILGNCDNVGDAKTLVKLHYGNNPIRWQRSDTQGVTEAYIGYVV